MKKLLYILTLAMAVLLSSCSATKRLSAVERDGSSFEKAIVVKSVAEEYKYVGKQCDNCEFQSQTLVFEKKKPYDILYVIKPNGEKEEYYFDISKFYGKMF